MDCPKCEQGHQDQIKTKVIDSRLQPDQVVRRRRECLKCKFRFTTWESAMNMDSRKSLSRIFKKRIDKIKKQAQTIVDNINKDV